MAINNKYNKEERKIVNKIEKLKSAQSNCRRRWLEYDIRINVLKKKLGGKYGKQGKIN